MKSWLAQGSSGRRVTLLPGTTFLHINGALVFAIFIGDLASKDKTMKETRRIHDVNLSIKSTLTFITK